MKAIKGNKEYTINETMKKSYMEAGYDIIDDSGKIIEYGRGKSIPYAEYMGLKAKYDKLLKETGKRKASSKDGE